MGKSDLTLFVGGPADKEVFLVDRSKDEGEWDGATYFRIQFAIGFDGETKEVSAMVHGAVIEDLSSRPDEISVKLGEMFKNAMFHLLIE